LLAIVAAAVALKVAVVAPPATVTDAGTVSAALLLAKVTVDPPAGAVCVKVTVQLLTALCPRLVGLHSTPDTCAGTGATRLIVAVCMLLLVPPGRKDAALAAYAPLLGLFHCAAYVPEFGVMRCAHPFPFAVVSLVKALPAAVPVTVPCTLATEMITSDADVTVSDGPIGVVVAAWLLRTAH
jgi:hypothetical protein